MAKVNDGKKIQKKRTADEMNAALADFCNGTPQRCIPPQVDDSDIVLSDAIAEVLELRAKVEEFAAGWQRGWQRTAESREYEQTHRTNPHHNGDD